MLPNNINKFVNNQYNICSHTIYECILLKVYKYIHTNIHYKILMQSPCNIAWVYPTQNQVGKTFMMLKYTPHTFTLTSSHITWVHVTSFQLQPIKF